MHQGGLQRQICPLRRHGRGARPRRTLSHQNIGHWLLATRRARSSGSFGPLEHKKPDGEKTTKTRLCPRGAPDRARRPIRPTHRLGCAGMIGRCFGGAHSARGARTAAGGHALCCFFGTRFFSSRSSAMNNHRLFMAESLPGARRVLTGGSNKLPHV